MADNDRYEGGRAEHVDVPDVLAGGRVKVLSRKTLWQGFVHLLQLQVEVPTFKGGRMKQLREIHDHGRAACILPIDPVHRTALFVHQWRIPPLLMGDNEPLLEVVAGIVDDGETPENCVHRESVEETGYEVSDLVKIMEGYSSPGTVTEYFYLFAGRYDRTRQRHDGGGLDHEEEDVERVELSFDDLRVMVKEGRIRDAKTFIAVSWLLANYD